MTAELTLVMLTHNRPDFFRRALSYYGYFGFPIVVLDSSEDSNENVAQRYVDVSYCHRPGETFLKKINYGLSKVDTPFMVFLSDDDFVLLPALNSSVEFLQSSPEYTFCHGYCLMYLPEAKKIHYFYRDKKVCEDYASDDPRERVLSFMGQYIPPFYAVTRTEILKKWYSLVPEDMGFEFQEVGQAIYYLYSGKARILSIPYIVRESNYIESEHGTDMYRALVSPDQKYVDMRRHFVNIGSKIFAGAEGDSSLSIRSFLLEAMSAAANCLESGRSLTLQEIFTSEWPILADKPVWTFAPTQFVEMPFYNKEFFALLESIDFLMRTMPYGKLQREQLKTVLAKQDAVLAELNEQGGEKALSRLIPKISSAFQAYPFYRDMAVKLHELFLSGVAGLELLNGYKGWVSRINDAPRRAALSQPDEDSWRASLNERSAETSADKEETLESWLEKRAPTKNDLGLVTRTLENYGGGPTFGIFILDLKGTLDAVIASIRSLDAERGFYQRARLVVLTLHDIPVENSSEELRFVKVNSQNFVDTLNKEVVVTACDWFVLIQAGETFTSTGLQTLALELLEASDCQAVYGDELHRQSDASLSSWFRPAFNLDYLLSYPGAMSRHWFFRRDVFIAQDGFDPQFPQSFEFDLILRLVETDGMAGLAHVDEAILITDAPCTLGNEDEPRALLRHLLARGYEHASVLSSSPGLYRIDYGHQVTPTVSILIPLDASLNKLQLCLETLLEHTDYPRYSVVLIAGHDYPSDVADWANKLATISGGMVRVFECVQAANASAMYNAAAAEVDGEYLVILSGDVEFVSGDWLAEMLNHAQRPEVGVVGTKISYTSGPVRHAGIVLGLRGPAGGAFIGEAGDSPGYMGRLQVVQNYSAVSRACMMVSRSVFAGVGGFDTVALARDFADVDFCLKVQASGYLTVWTPFTALRQGIELEEEKVVDYREQLETERHALYGKWLPQLARDPAYNQNLSLAGFGFTPAYRKAREWSHIGPSVLPRILCHPSDANGCGHYRLYQPFFAMERDMLIQGMSTDQLLAPVELERFAPDSIIYQRQFTPNSLLLREESNIYKGVFRVMDMDDFIPGVPEKSIHYKQIPKNVMAYINKSLSLVDRFVVSTAPLAEAFSGLHPDIQVVQNRLPVDWWGNLHSQRRVGRKPRVGWAGGTSHTGDLELLFDVVRTLANEVEWVFFGMCPGLLKPYIHEFHTGISIEKYPERLAALNLDLALAPLEMNLFNECKSNLRLLEYGACGFPVICTDIVTYRSGMPVTLVKNRTEDWLEAIRMHLSDLDASAKAGDALRKVVMRDWMLQGDALLEWRRAWLPN